MRRLIFLLLLMVTSIQTAGILDGVSHCAKILSGFYDNNDTSDINDYEGIIKIDVSNAFNTAGLALTLDVLSGYASRDYVCGLKHKDLLSALVSLYPTCLFTFTPCAHAMLSYDALTGMERLTWRRAKGRDNTTTR
jgi:hypothetical protein